MKKQTCVLGKNENCYIYFIGLYMCTIAGNLRFENVYRSYVDLNTMEQCFVTLFYKTFHHSMLMYILCTMLITLYDSKVLRILCVSLCLQECFLYPLLVSNILSAVLRCLCVLQGKL
jgi:hypothetical protein